VLREARQDRFAEVCRLAARAPGIEPPLGLESRIVAFAQGAAARRNRGLGRLASIAGFATAAAMCVLWALRPSVPEPAQDSPAPVPTGRPVPAPSPATPHPAIEALRAAPGWRSRALAAEVLGRQAPEPSADEALARALTEDPNWRVRDAALRSLRDRPGSAVAVALARASEDPHIGIRVGAVSALAERLSQGPPVTDALLARLRRDPDWRVRDVALALLLRSPQGARAAALALADGHRRLRARARAALATLAW
jgi:hypothetical protein